MGPKNLKSLQAKVQAIQADKLTQEAAFELRNNGLSDSGKTSSIGRPSAPGDGIVVYVNQPDWSGCHVPNRSRASAQPGPADL